MKKTALFCAILSFFVTTAYADGLSPEAEKRIAAVTSSEEAENTISTAELISRMPTDKQVEKIDAKEMQARLEKGCAEDFAYFKFSDEEVLVYELLAGDKATCQELFFATPKENMVNVYTNNKNTMKSLWKAFKSKNGEWDAENGYKLAGAKSPVQKLENGGEIYKLWYQKVKADSRRVKVGRSGLPVPISIDIPIGRGRHRPRIGIGL